MLYHASAASLHLLTGIEQQVYQAAQKHGKPCHSYVVSGLYQARPETRPTGSASLAILTLFLVSPDKLDTSVFMKHKKNIAY